MLNFSPFGNGVVGLHGESDRQLCILLEGGWRMVQIVLSQPWRISMKRIDAELFRLYVLRKQSRRSRRFSAAHEALTLDAEIQIIHSVNFRACNQDVNTSRHVQLHWPIYLTMEKILRTNYDFSVSFSNWQQCKKLWCSKFQHDSQSDTVGGLAAQAHVCTNRYFSSELRADSLPLHKRFSHFEPYIFASTAHSLCTEYELTIRFADGVSSHFMNSNRLCFYSKNIFEVRVLSNRQLS